MKLELCDVRICYGSGANSLTAVDGVNLGIPKRGTLGLVGESGCGKSTLARAIVGLTPLTAGTILLDDADYSATRRRNSREFRRRVQMIFQDPYSSLNPRMSVEDMLLEVLAMIGAVRRADRRADAIALLEMVGLPSSSLKRFPHQFSGGQLQRLAIARALALKPEIIIHDEVTSALDVSVQATVLNLLRKLQEELGLSYLFISHDLSTVRYMSDSVAVMYLGRLVEVGAADDVFDRPAHPYTRALIAAIPQFGKKRRAAALTSDVPDPRRPPSGCRFHTRCPVGPTQRPDRQLCVESDPQSAATRHRNVAACHFAELVGDEQREAEVAFDE